MHQPFIFGQNPYIKVSKSCPLQTGSAKPRGTCTHWMRSPCQMMERLLGNCCRSPGVNVCSCHALRGGSESAQQAAHPPGGVLDTTKERARRPGAFLDPPPQLKSQGTDELPPPLLREARGPSDTHHLCCGRSN